jgi:hypothetical protein
MALEGWDPIKFSKDFEREELNARKRAGRKIGRKNVADAKRALGRVSPVRKKMITSKVNKKTGTLVHVDRASDSRAREYGEDYKAKPGKAIRINLDRQYRDTDGDFIGSIGGRLFVFEGEGEAARPIAILKQTVRRPAVERSKRLSKIVEDRMGEYMKQIEEELSNG